MLASDSRKQPDRANLNLVVFRPLASTRESLVSLLNEKKLAPQASWCAPRLSAPLQVPPPGGVPPGDSELLSLLHMEPRGARQELLLAAPASSRRSAWRGRRDAGLRRTSIDHDAEHLNWCGASTSTTKCARSGLVHGLEGPIVPCSRRCDSQHPQSTQDDTL
jgi:hypothetical protein